ncbi:hypothetical protein LINPERHAP1_LOCUS31340 [Linum perenne]
MPRLTRCSSRYMSSKRKPNYSIGEGESSSTPKSQGPWFRRAIQSPSKRKINTKTINEGGVTIPPLREPPNFLKSLIQSGCQNSQHFHKNIRAYNGVFCFTSMGGKVNHKLNSGSAPYIYSIGGQIFHRIGSLLPPEGQAPSFLQLYIHDSDNEIMNRLNSISKDTKLRESILQELRNMLDEHNALVKVFRENIFVAGHMLEVEGDDIWAEIPVSLLDRFTHLMVEQKSYTIHQLNVIAAPEEYRPTSNKFVIQFHALTTVEEIPDIPSIPYYKFTFITETELRAGCETENPTVLLDVIGHVIDYSRTQNCQEELCLWNRFVAMMDEVLAANGDKPLVLIATSVYIRLRNGNPVLYTSSATQLCGNLQIPEVLHFFNWYASEVTAPVLINPSDITKTPVVTIEETNALIKESNNQESGEAKE